MTQVGDLDDWIAYNLLDLGKLRQAWVAFDYDNVDLS